MTKKTKSYKFIPGPGEHGSLRVGHLDDDLRRIMKHDIIKWKRANRLTVYGNELWVWENDQTAKRKFRV